jgi:hypothetical protein
LNLKCDILVSNFAFQGGQLVPLRRVHARAGEAQGGAVQVETIQLTLSAWNRMVSTLERYEVKNPVSKWKPGFKVCFFEWVNLCRYAAAKIASPEWLAAKAAKQAAAALKAAEVRVGWQPFTFHVWYQSVSAVPLTHFSRLIAVSFCSSTHTLFTTLFCGGPNTPNQWHPWQPWQLV